MSTLHDRIEEGTSSKVQGSGTLKFRVQEINTSHPRVSPPLPSHASPSTLLILDLEGP